MQQVPFWVTRSDAGPPLPHVELCTGDLVDLFDAVTDLVGFVARLLVGTWGGRSLLLIALAGLPIVAVATHK